MTTLIIARHGNTFEEGETPRYIGARTDLTLTERGRGQARAIGRYLKDNALIPDAVYSSTLKRTIETAQIAVEESRVANPVFPLEIFDEIDYGPDENKTRQDIAARIGEQALTDWDENGIVPPGWSLDPAQAIRNWMDFADQIRAHDDNETVLAVTSNGIARFAPHITGDYGAFRKTHHPKMATGALSVFLCENGIWRLQAWNLRP